MKRNGGGEVKVEGKKPAIDRVFAQPYQEEEARWLSL